MLMLGHYRNLWYNVQHVNIGRNFIEVITKAGRSSSKNNIRGVIIKTMFSGQNTAVCAQKGLDLLPHRSYHVDAPGIIGTERMRVLSNRTPYIEHVPAKPAPPKTVRVAAYARVSADKDAAFHSLEAQTEYYETYIAAHPDWELVDIYSDNGISGTIINRPEFQRLLMDCRAGKIDLVVTKSITRFARNTVVLLATIRELKSLGIDCYFEKENMHSISPDGELLLTLLAMYAEEEARSVSENQKWRIKKRFEKGEPWKGRMLGYRLGEGKLEIVPEEAEIVRQIFSDYLSGMSMLAITKRLNAQGIPSPLGGTWSRMSVRHILANEKYTGDMILQKTYCPDFRTKKKMINRGQVTKYLVTGSHEAIISKEDFETVQERLRQNSTTNHQAKSNEPRLFAGLIRCGYCGGSFAHRYNNSIYKRPVWVCRRNNEFTKAACPSQSIPETILIEKTREVLGLNASDALDRELLLSKIEKIVVPEHHKLVFYLKDGTTTVSVEWQYKSRSESWTPEMREAARQKALARNAERRKQNESKQQ